MEISDHCSVIVNLRKLATSSFHLPSSALSVSARAKCRCHQFIGVSLWLLQTASRSAIMYRDNFRVGN